MKTRVILESGYRAALLGLSLSFNSKPSARVAAKLAHKQGGHNKFLESMVVWLDMTAPRYFWQQFDTYRVGTTKQSESTMHTITRRQLVPEDFSWKIDSSVIEHINSVIANKDMHGAKALLPESFLQRRIVCLNYKVLQNMEYQRRTHKLLEWQQFLDAILEQVEHPLFIKVETEDGD